MDDYEAHQLLQRLVSYYRHYGADSDKPSKMTVLEIAEDLATANSNPALQESMDAALAFLRSC